MNKKSTGLDWYYSKDFWKLEFQVQKTLKQYHNLLFVNFTGFLFFQERPPGKWRNIFQSGNFVQTGKVRGNLDKLLERSGKFGEFVYLVLFFITQYFLKIDPSFQSSRQPGGFPQ